MLSHYIKAKSEGWAKPLYKAHITFEDKEKFSFDIEGSWFDLIQLAAKYLNYRITHHWIIYENDKKLPLSKLMELFYEAQTYNSCLGR